MPPIQIRLRTLMIVIAALAVSITLLMAWLRWIARTPHEFVLIVFFAVTVVIILPLLLQVIVLSWYFGLGKTRRDEFRITADSPGRKLDLDRDGEHGVGVIGHEMRSSTTRFPEH
jgi:hypothetical protein